MKKWIFAIMALLVMTVFFGKPTKPERQSAETLNQTLQKGIAICQKLKEDNESIKRDIFAMFLITSQDEKKCIELGQLIFYVEKAEKLIDESDRQLQEVIPEEIAREKMIKIKNNLKEANSLHKKILNGLSTLLSSEPKPVPVIDA